MLRTFGLGCILTLAACSGGPGGTTSGNTTSATVAGTTSGSTETSASGTTGSATTTSGSSGTTSGSSGSAPTCGEVCDLGNLNGQGLGCNATCTLFGQVTTLAGSSQAGLVDGTGIGAAFGRPYGLAVMGDFLYVSDISFHAIRAVNLVDIYVQTIAGGHFGQEGSCVDGNGEATAPASGLCEPDALLPFDGGLIVTDYGALRFLALSPTFDGGILYAFSGSPAVDGVETQGFDAGAFAQCIYGDPHGIAQVGIDLYTNTDIDGVIAESSLASTQLFPVENVGTIQEQGGMTALNGIVYSADSANPGNLYAYDPTASNPSVQPVTF